MKKSTFFVVFLLAAQLLFAQHNYTITYNYGLLDEATQEITPGKQSVLVIRDSMSYFYHLHYLKKYLPETPLGIKFCEFSVFTDLRGDMQLTQRYPAGLRRYLVEDSINNYKWTLLDESKLICGYLCKKAEGEMNGLKVIGWYAPSLPALFGPFNIKGLPGTLLEFRYRTDHYTYSAISIVKSAERIIPPSDGKLVSRSKFNQKLASLSSRPRIIIR